MGENLINESAKMAKNQIENRLLELESRFKRIQTAKNNNKQQKRNSKYKRSQSTDNNRTNNNNNKNIYQLLPNKNNNYSKISHNFATNYWRHKFNSKSRPNLMAANFNFDEPFVILDEEPKADYRSLLSRMETNQWNASDPRFDAPAANVQMRTRLMRQPRDERLMEKFLPLNDPISSSSGILLDSDLPSMEEKLDEIRQSLANLKGFNLNLASKDYYRYAKREKLNTVQNCLPHNSQKDYGSFGKVESLAEIRARILNMEFHIEQRIREILTAKINQRDYSRHHSPPYLRENWQNNLKHTVAKTQKDLVLSQNEKLEQLNALNLKSDYGNQVKNYSNEREEFMPNLNEHEITVLQQSGVAATTIQQNSVVNPLRKVVFATVNEEEQFPQQQEKNNIEENIVENKFAVAQTKDGNKDNVSADKISTRGTAAPAARSKTADLDMGVHAVPQQNSEHYNRMLEMLKRPKYAISSSSSSSDSDEYKIPKVKSTLTTNPQQNQQQLSANTTTNLENITDIKTNYKNVNNRKNIQTNDSDSDFFN